MNAVRQKCRPKHQVLILKCYPRFQKNAPEVKPNPSELSYLLYYASTRRSKLQKVGSFLAKKADNDAYKNKISNVQLTLQIVKALIEKLPRDLPLYASYVLRIFNSVLQSKDISMVEESIPTFETFCEHYDLATLAADQELIGQYEHIVQLYSSFASLKTPVQPKGGLNAPMAIRWRTAGLKALKCVATSEAVGAEGGRQMNMIMPVILQNLHFGDEHRLLALRDRAQMADSEDKVQNSRRRMSIATVRTSDAATATVTASDSVDATNSTDDADRLAEEEVGALAIACLRQIFVANNRAQIRLATGALLRFICSAVSPERPATNRSAESSTGSTWTTSIVEVVTRWAPVQDRFVILVTFMESLVRSPVAEENLEQQLLLVSLIRWLLRSTINMIGLSVMDVLLGLIQHILLLLQLGGKGSSVLPHHQQTDAIDLFRGTEEILGLPKPPVAGDQIREDESSPSSNRQELLLRLHCCIGDLATHIYYSDQVSDILTAILLRLKPSPQSGIGNIAAAIENPEAAAKAIADSVSLKDDPDTHEFFSFGTARVTALTAIKEVLTTANAKGSASATAAIGRNRVGVQVWEGTQWLLRDEDRRVRRAYVDALITWLHLELGIDDLKVPADRRKFLRPASKTDLRYTGDKISRRATSNASKMDRDQIETSKKSTFLQLLHLAIYENATETPESEEDILLLHLLLHSLLANLGVNAVKTGLPMIVRLQEDLLANDSFKTPNAKINIASLIQGYFWALTDKFEFDTTTTGQTIQAEITKRKKYGLWLDTIQIPPIPLNQILTAAVRPSIQQSSHKGFEPLQFQRFESRAAIVERISDAYVNSFKMTPSSPPTSPGRVFSMPVLGGEIPGPRENELPTYIKNDMMSDWSKDAAIATAERESARTLSLTGSRRLGHHSLNGYNGSPNGDRSPARGRDGSKNDMRAAPALNFAFSQYQHSNTHSGPPTPLSNSSDHTPALRVDDLKRVLAGELSISSRGVSPLRPSTARRWPAPTSTGLGSGRSGSHGRQSIDAVSVSSDSVMSADGYESASEGDPSRPISQAVNSSTTSMPPPRENNGQSNANKVKPKTKPAPIDPPPLPSTQGPVMSAVPSAPTRNSSTHSRRSSTNPPTPRSSSQHPPQQAHAPRSRPHSGSEHSYSAYPPSTPRSLRRPSTSSSAAGEDPDLNAAALRGDVLPSRLSIDFGYGGPESVPPVPPLPPNVTTGKGPRPISGASSGVIGAQSLSDKSGVVSNAPHDDVPAVPPIASPENHRHTVETSETKDAVTMPPVQPLGDEKRPTTAISSKTGLNHVASVDSVTGTSVSGSTRRKRNTASIDVGALLGSIDSVGHHPGTLVRSASRINHSTGPHTLADISNGTDTGQAGGGGGNIRRSQFGSGLGRPPY